MNYLKVFRYVIFKPAMTTMFPALSSLFITLMLGSSILSAISTPELNLRRLQHHAYYYRHFEVFFSSRPSISPSPCCSRSSSGTSKYASCGTRGRARPERSSRIS